MNEVSHYTEENFDLSYTSRQKELRRMIIVFRCRHNLGIDELAQKAGIPVIKLNAMELGDEKITLLDFAKILDAGGFFENVPLW